jgi:hypothetical protein
VRRSVVGLLWMAGASAIMTGSVLVAGLLIPPSAPPIELSKHLSGLATNTTGNCLVAPVTMRSAFGDVGQAILCYDGSNLRATLRVSGLTPGEMYSGWLAVGQRQAPCPEDSCISSAPLGTSAVGLMEQLGGSVVPSSGTLELQRELRDVRLLNGAEVVLTLLHSASPAGRHAQAIFNVP